MNETAQKEVAEEKFEELPSEEKKTFEAKPEQEEDSLKLIPSASIAEIENIAPVP